MAGWDEPPERSAGGPDQPQPGWEQQPQVPPPAAPPPGQQQYPGQQYPGEQYPHEQQPLDPGGNPQPPYGGQQPPPQGWSDPGMAGPPPRKKRTGLLVGLISAGVVVVLVIVAGVYAVSAGIFSSGHTITLANSAGGLKRDKKAQGSVRVPGKNVAEFRRGLRKQLGASVDQVKVGPYVPKGGSGGDAIRDVLFLGATVKDGQHFAPKSVINRLRARINKRRGKFPGVALEVREVSAGSQGGAAMCDQLSDSGGGSVDCLWVDKDTYGDVKQSGTSVPHLATAASRMRAMRADLETSK